MPTKTKKSALEELKALEAEIVAKGRDADAARAEFMSSGRWLDRARANLSEYLSRAPARRDPDEERALRDAVQDHETFRVVISQVGRSTHYGDRRALNRLEDAEQARQDAESERARFIAENRDRLQAEMMGRSVRARDELVAALGVVSAAWSGWYGVRRDWAGLLERWGGSPAELPRLPIQDPQALLDLAFVDQERYGGVPRRPGQLVPAPSSLVDGEAAGGDGVTMRPVTLDDLAAPLEQEWPAA